MPIPQPEARGYAGNLGSPFVEHAGSSRAALIDLYDASAPRTLSYRELDAACNALARGLVRAGLKPGDRIGILSLNQADFVITLLGAMRAVPRHRFVPAAARRLAYGDHPPRRHRANQETSGRGQDELPQH